MSSDREHNKRQTQAGGKKGAAGKKGQVELHVEATKIRIEDSKVAK